jgi:hypothetical protein
MLLPESVFSVVSSEAWAVCAATLTLRFYVTGAAWNWLLPDAVLGDVRKISSAMFYSACALLVGVPCSLLISLLLSELGVATLGREILCSLLITAIGLLTGISKAPHRTRRAVRLSWPGALVMFAGMAVVMGLPRCGEWIVGGWDPGVYVNEGVCVGRTGTFHPGPQPQHADLLRHELPLFTRGNGMLTECFPAVPLDPQERSIRHYFFRLTPTLIGALTRCGGLCAATRVNMIMGCLGLIVFVAFLRVNRCSPSLVLTALVLFATHPLWIYHLHLPTSEMSELFLVLGLGAAMPLQRTGWYGRGLFLLLLFSAVLNRVSFVPFAGMMVLATAWADMERGDRRRVLQERALQALTIGAAVYYDFTATAVTMKALRYVVPELLVVGGVLLALAVCVDLMAAYSIPRRIMSPTLVFGVVLGSVAVIGLGALLFGRQVPALASTRQNVRHVWPYLGTGLAVLTVPGALVVWFVHVKRSRYLAAVIMVLAGISLLLMVRSFVVPIYPWATRRYLPFTVPLLAVLAGSVLSELWSSRGGAQWVRRAIVVAVLGLVLAGTARRSWHALSRTEYDGLSLRLAEVAQHIGPRDLVVADHFKWGTPLMLIYGKHVLDGSQFYGKSGKTVMPRGMRALKRLKGLGWQVRFLTSTPAGLGVYPREIRGATLVWSSAPLTLKEFIHSPRARDFVLRDRSPLFRLYALP